MASPQKENGYTAIANELLEALARTRLSPQEWSVLVCIIRKTYGWKEKTTYISYREIAEFTGIDIRHIPNVLKKLSEKNMIIRDNGKLGLQKNYDIWNLHLNRGHLNRCKNYTQTGVKFTPKQVYETGRKPKPEASLQTPKENKENKEIYLSTSLSIANGVNEPNKAKEREIICKRLKNYFPDLRTEHIPTERLDYFLYLIEAGKINTQNIRDPARYIQSHKLVLEPFPCFSDREAKRKKEKMEELARKEKQRKEQEYFLSDEYRKMMQAMISSFRTMEGGQC